MKILYVLLVPVLCTVLIAGCTSFEHSEAGASKIVPDDNSGLNASAYQDGTGGSPPADAGELLRKGKLNETESLFRSRVVGNNTTSSDWFNLGVVLMEEKKFPESMEAFEKADLAGLDQKDPYWYSKGIVNLGMGHYEEAERYFRLIEPNDTLYAPGLVLTGIAKRFSGHGDGIDEMKEAEQFDQTCRIAADNRELFSIEEADPEFSMPSFVSPGSDVLEREGNERVVADLEELVAAYYQTHEYSSEDLFVCTDMALDLWDQLKAKGIPAYIVIGCLDKRFPSDEEFDHAWVVAEPVSGKYVALDATSGEANLTNERYYHGYYFDNPKSLKEYTDLIDDYQNQADVVNRMVDRYNQRHREYSAALSDLNQNVEIYNIRYAQRSLSASEYGHAASLEAKIDAQRVKVEAMEEELASLDDQISAERSHLKSAAVRLKSLPAQIRTADLRVQTPLPVLLS